MIEKYRPERRKGKLGKTLDVVHYAVDKLSPGAFAAIAIYSLRQGDYITAGASASMASMILYDAGRNERHIRDRAWSDGATAGAWVKDVLVRFTDSWRGSGVFGLDSELKPPPKNEPRYRSLDGVVKIYNAGKLLESVGEPDEVVDRISRSMDYADSVKDVGDTSKVEYLRKVQAVLRMLPEAAVLFKDKPELLKNINDEVAVYEREYRDKHKAQ